MTAGRLVLRRTRELRPPGGDQVLTSGVSAVFIMAAIFAVVAALIAGHPGPPRRPGRLKGGTGPGG
jgi:hypothetical protein